MTATAEVAVLKQHLIDPEICIRCNTCEEICPVDAITHDSRNYVVDADICNACMACISPCPTGSIDNWRTILRLDAYSTAEQLTWDELPTEKALPEGVAEVASGNTVGAQPVAETEVLSQANSAISIGAGSTLPPWSAAHPYVNLFGHKSPLTATVSGNFRVTSLGTESDTHHKIGRAHV